MIVTWSLPAGNNTLNSRVTITNNIRTTMLASSQPNLIMSMSRDLNWVAITTTPPLSHRTILGVHDMSTGRRLAMAGVDSQPQLLWFTRDGREIWSLGGGGKSEGWEIPQGRNKGRGSAELKSSVRAATRFPWQSHRGYRSGVTGDGWVLSPTQKRLLWLPHYWRFGLWDTTWGGRYLGLKWREVPEVVILEFPE